MCGINGIFKLRSTEKVAEILLCKMRDSLEHRGPDDKGVYLDRNLGLGHRRLSILDTSAAGHQPYISKNQRYALVFNGEIYNFREFYAELKADGNHIETQSDTEVLMLLFEKYGLSFLSNLQGMFAIAIWDKLDKKLLLIRDRMGVKPLYYAVFRETLYFASEQKALFTAGVPLKIATNGLQEYVFNRFVAGENTLFENVYKVLPGHFMEIFQDGKIKQQQWWNLSTAIQEHPVIKNPVEWFRETFDASVKLRMVSDAPVGVLLSGGLDSSSILASLYHQKFQNIENYTVGFSDAAHNEAHLAKLMSDHCGYSFNTLELQGEDLFNKMSRMAYLNDEPLVHLSEPHLFAVSEMAKSKVKVLLSGEGADELMGGYVRYKALQNRSLLSTINKLGTLGNFIKNPRYEKLIRYSSLENNRDLVYFNGSNLYPKEINKIFGISETPENSYRKQIFEQSKTLYPKDLRRQAMFFDQHTYMCSLLDRNDRCTMGASIECREPFLDQRLLAGLGTLESKWFFKGVKGKFVQLKAMEKRLPPEILNFRKVGLSTPWQTYLTKDESFREEINTFRKSPIFELPLFSSIDINALVNTLESGQSNIVPFIIPLFMMHVWYKNYVEKF